MARIVLHIDLNAFFVTCEIMKDPSIKGKPVIIGRTGRGGIVSTCSYEARAKGVHSGMPTFQALKLCPEAIIRHEDFGFYEVMSNSFFAYISKYTNIIEKFSIDECFADFTEQLSNCTDPAGYLRSMQNGLRRETGLTCSIGVANTKFLAKMASDLQKPNGLTFLWKEDIPAKLYPLPIGDFFGIGKKSAPKYIKAGIYTIGDLARRLDAGDQALIAGLGSFYQTIDDWIHGRGSDVVHTERMDPQSIGHSTTLMSDTNQFEDIEPYIRTLAKEVAQDAKRQRKVGRAVSIVAKDPGFKLHSKSVQLETPTNDEKTISDKAVALYKKNFVGMDVRLVGVTLAKLVTENTETVQMTFFNYEEYEKKDETRALINKLNRQLDKPLLMRGSQAKKGNGK